MKKHSPLRKAFLTVAISLCFAPSVFAAEAGQQTAKSPLPLQEIRQFTDVYAAVKAFYVDENQTQDRKLLENALAGMLSGLDPHSAFLDKEAFEEMKEGTEGEFGGLGLEVTMDASGVLVIAPIDDTPAARAGIRAGDIIVKIDDQATRAMTLSENVKLMRGKPKTKIKLVIARKGVDKPLNITITRDIIKVQSVKMKELADGIAYIRISQFQEHTADDLAKYLIELDKKQHLKGLVLDLRNDPGGLLNAAIGVVSAFIEKDKTVVSTKGRTPESNRSFKTRQADYLNHAQDPKEDWVTKVPQSSKTVPMVVLINAASASASEIVSGALQDHKRAKIVGQQSFGKGSVQTVLPLRPLDGGKPSTGIKLTTSRYYTPSGRSIQATGITPDIEIADTPGGNYATFNIREADLAHHLKNDEEKRAYEKKQREESKKQADDAKQPELRYFYGNKKDFQLQKAVKILKGEKYVTGFEKKSETGKKTAKNEKSEVKTQTDKK